MEHELYPDNTSYNIVSCLRLSGDLNFKAFKKAITEIIQRHEIFRTTFSVKKSEPCQIIHQFMEVVILETALNSLSHKEQDTEIKRFIRKESQSPFNLAQGPLFRFTLLSLNNIEHVFLMTIHHIVMDGWSVGLFANELSIFYDAFCNNMPLMLPEPAIQYSDYAICQNEKYKYSQENDSKYWNDVIKGAVWGGFPADFPRVFGKKGESATKTATIPADLTEKLKSFSREEHATPFITLMAGLQVVLYRYTGNENLLLGCYTAGRDQKEVRSLPGQYSNLSVIKTAFSGDPDFREIIKRTRRSLFSAYEHGYLLGSLRKPLKSHYMHIKFIKYRYND